MLAIVVYDTAVERNAAVLRTCRKYLHWVQGSVFQGELSRAQVARLKSELHSHLVPDYDSVVLYLVPDGTNITRDVLGRDKCQGDNVL